MRLCFLPNSRSIQTFAFPSGFAIVELCKTVHGRAKRESAITFKFSCEFYC